ncbi:MAG: hypothetical protein MPW15_11610 [Candidatus Manganitrophus sp.]|nr:hypothetical protein [Candidatus Manganitrophus sp.]
MPVLHKGGLPGLEHRYIQEALQEEHYPELSAIALLEGRPGQEHLRIFHNRFANHLSSTSGSSITTRTRTSFWQKSFRITSSGSPKTRSK